MIPPRHIDADGKQVVVRLMDDSWIINRCAGSHPFTPEPGIVWAHSDRCARLGIPGDELPSFMRTMRDAYGNCAAIAWHEGRVLGHIVFLPRSVARARQASGWEHFRGPADDETTLVVINLAFCSLSGHEFRRKGIGKALVEVMLDWARASGWKRVEVYDVGGGLFPCEWYDLCIPPRPFWEGRGFSVAAERPGPLLNDEALRAVLSDNPRNSGQEQRQKERTIADLRHGLVDPSRYAFRYDLQRDI